MPVSGRKSQRIIPVIFVSLILTIDQCLKYIVRHNMSVGESIPLVRNILHITFVRNTGAAFGLFKKGTLVFAVISVVAIVFISTLLIKTIRQGELFKRPIFNFGLMMIFSGAMGNLVDRLFFRYVIDFIDVRIWPVFNIADSSITIGTFLLISSFISKKHL